MIDSTPIEKIALGLLRDLDMKTPPVDVKSIASHLQLKVLEEKLDSEISGALVLEQGKGVIGVDKSQSPQRQRFTIAHEIGHYKLHYKPDKMFIDEHVYLRSNQSNLEEIEANAFAASLLMPKFMIDNFIKENEYTFIGDDQINKLAKKFNVSSIAMTYRLSNLNII